MYCTVEDCNNKQRCKNYCAKHYARIKRGKDVNTKTTYDKRPAIIENDIAKIPIGLNAKDGYAIVDAKFAWLDKYNWSIKHGYAHNSRVGAVHHLIVSKPKRGYVVDHKNHNTLDNRLDNLRIITHHQNSMNHKIRNKQYGFKGITQEGARWKAQIMFNRKHIHLGRYKTPEEAAIAYNKAALKYFGEYAHLNKIQG